MTPILPEILEFFILFQIESWFVKHCGLGSLETLYWNLQPTSDNPNKPISQENWGFRVPLRFKNGQK